MDSEHISILLDIKSDIGALNARMLEASHSRQRMENSIDQLKSTVDDIKPVVAVVSEMKPEVEDLKNFKNRIGSYLWVGGTIATGALYLLWQGVVYFSDNIKTAIGRLFH